MVIFDVINTTCQVRIVVHQGHKTEHFTQQEPISLCGKRREVSFQVEIREESTRPRSRLFPTRCCKAPVSGATCWLHQQCRCGGGSQGTCSVVSRCKRLPSRHVCGQDQRLLHSCPSGYKERVPPQSMNTIATGRVTACQLPLTMMITRSPAPSSSRILSGASEILWLQLGRHT